MTDVGVWAPTHRVPGSGATCYAAPDPDTPALAERLGPALEVRSLERRGDWMHVECSNGWTAWVDARPMEDLAPPAPATPAPEPSTDGAFHPTHVVPAGGLAAYASHDVALPAVATLDERLPVQVVDRWGDWAHIACSNQWTAWVDGRVLEPDGAPAQAAPTAIARRRNPLAGALLLLLTVPRSVSGALPATGALSILGAALVTVGSFLPLLSVDGLPSTSAWDVPAAFLVSDTPDPSGFKLGMLLLVAVLALLPLLTRRALPPLLLLLFAAPATNTAVRFLVLKARVEGYPSLGPGTLLVIAGGALLLAQAAWWLWRERRRAFA